MSLNQQTEGKSLYDVLDGSVTSYFTRLAGVLQRNGSVNGLYKTTITSSYGANTPFKIPSFGRLCISTNGAAVVDMSNSFIEMKLTYTLKFSKAIAAAKDNMGAGNRVLFIGPRIHWKPSVGMIFMLIQPKFIPKLGLGRKVSYLIRVSVKR
jgi:hypothetical protein